jgi:hypothetical protein
MEPLAPPSPIAVADQDPYWRPIGRLVFAYGHLESQIDWCISALLDADAARDEPSVASQIRNICSRIALIEALFRQHTSDRKKRSEMHDLIKKLGVIIKFRNGVLHGPWGTYFEDRRTWQKPRTHPVDLSPGSFDVTVESIDVHIQMAEEIGNALLALVRSVTADERPRSVRHAS